MSYLKNVLLDVLSLGGFLLIGGIVWLLFLLVATVLILFHKLTGKQERTLLNWLLGSLVGLLLAIIVYAVLMGGMIVISPSNTPKHVTFDRMELVEPDVPEEKPEIVDLTKGSQTTDEERQERFDSLVDRK